MRRIVWALTLGVLAAGMPVARASHPTQMCLDIEPDTHSTIYNDDVVEVLRAYPGATDAGHPPEHEGCVTETVESGQDWSGTNIDFEVVGVGDPDSSDSPTTPDLTCTVASGQANCYGWPSSSESGTQTIRAWVDSDLNDATVEADISEGYDETTTPGDLPEPDATDVALWNWNRSEHSFETTVTISFDDERRIFYGSVHSQHSLCWTERSIKLFRQRRDGSRILKQTVVTDDDGVWKVPGFHPSRGRFYAVANLKQVDDLVGSIRCLRDRSRTVRLR